MRISMSKQEHSLAGTLITPLTATASFSKFNRLPRSPFTGGKKTTLHHFLLCCDPTTTLPVNIVIHGKHPGYIVLVCNKPKKMKESMVNRSFVNDEQTSHFYDTSRLTI